MLNTSGISARPFLPSILALGLIGTITPYACAGPVWSGYAGDPQHSAVSLVPSQSLDHINWSMPIDLDPQITLGDLYIHYGTPVITAANTVIVPIKTGAADGFQLTAVNGATGAVQYTLTTDYSLPPHDWTPSYSPALTPDNRLYYAGAGGTVYVRDNADSPTGTTTQIAFYGNSAYADNTAIYDASVQISTPITSDKSGNIYFGYRVSGPLPPGSNLSSGIARISATGQTSFISAATITGDPAVTAVSLNSAPALSTDGTKLYVALSAGSAFNTSGYLAALNASTLQTQAVVQLKDPHSGGNALMSDDSTASPMVAPNGDVYFGVLENPFLSNNDRGWLLHFSGDLSESKTPGAFGWDDTPSVVPASMVPTYHGPSTYLVMSKYNNYAGAGSGDGINKLAILDPASSMTDPITGATVMKEVLTIDGVTPDGGGVSEWCINTAVVDPATDSILVNSEDGKLYRWNLASNSFTQVITLTEGIGEAYTPTLIGADGAVYAINDSTLFSVGGAALVPEPSAIFMASASLLLLAKRPRRANHK